MTPSAYPTAIPSNIPSDAPSTMPTADPTATRVTTNYTVTFELDDDADIDTQILIAQIVESINSTSVSVLSAEVIDNSVVVILQIATDPTRTLQEDTIARDIENELEAQYGQDIEVSVQQQTAARDELEKDSNASWLSTLTADPMMLAMIGAGVVVLLLACGVSLLCAYFFGQQRAQKRVIRAQSTQLTKMMSVSTGSQQGTTNPGGEGADMMITKATTDADDGDVYTAGAGMDVMTAGAGTAGNPMYEKVGPGSPGSVASLANTADLPETPGDGDGDEEYEAKLDVLSDGRVVVKAKDEDDEEESNDEMLYEAKETAGNVVTAGHSSEEEEDLYKKSENQTRGQ